MSRAGYCEDIDQWDLIRWRGAVTSAIRGARGQAFFRDMLAALDAMPVKELIASELVSERGCCALGAVAKKWNIDVSGMDPEDYEQISKTFGIAEAMVREIEYVNDEWGSYSDSPAKRWTRVRAWVAEQIK